MTGAPHPSMPVAATGSPASSASVSLISCCSGWAGSRYVARSQPFATQVASIAACLPEQFWARELAGRPSATQDRRSASSYGRSGVFCRSSSFSPAPSRIRRTPSRWNGSPEWLALARASSSPSRSRPARTMASACSGLLEDRGKVGPVTSPTESSTVPAPSTATTLPWWTDSTKPERTTWARTGAAYRDGVGEVTARA